MAGQLVPYTTFILHTDKHLQLIIALLFLCAYPRAGETGLICCRQEVTEKQKCMNSRIEDFVSSLEPKTILSELNIC